LREKEAFFASNVIKGTKRHSSARSRGMLFAVFGKEDEKAFLLRFFCQKISTLPLRLQKVHEKIEKKT